jgi:hypothetical protein
MKKLLHFLTTLSLLVSLVFLAPSASAWSETNNAVSVFSGTSTNSSEARWMALDSSGNILTAGFFRGTVDFDPGVGVANLTSEGSGDIFVSKLDSSGNYLWAKRMGGAGYDDAASVAVGKDGSVVTTGGFTGTVDFNPGDGVANLTSTGGDADILVRDGAGADIFVSKLDSSGNYLWAKRMGGVGFDHGIIPAVDRDGNIAVTGFFSETADFDPGERVFKLTSVGSTDIFISKFDSAGNFIWAKGAGSPGIDGGGGISFDSNGNIYVSGDFSETVGFDLGGSVFNLTSAGSTDIFISKLNSAGNFIWAKGAGGTDSEGSAPNVLDGSGNIYLTGVFLSTDFDPGDCAANLPSKGNYDSFVLKLNSSGNCIWAKSFGSTGWDEAYSISVDGNGDVITTGTFPGTVDFDPGVGVVNLIPAGGSDVFILKLDSSGNYRWAKQIGGTGSDRGYANVVDQTGMIYSTGVFSGTVDFDPGVGTSRLTSSVGRSIFISKLDSSGNAPLVAAVSAGSTPNSKVATIPSGGTEAAISATSALPAIKLNFGGTVPTAVTVVPVAANPAPVSATPFTLGSSKIVDIQITGGSFNGSVTVCLDGASTDRLYHYTGGTWVELGSRNYVNGQVCGVTTSFSPFVAAAPVVTVAPMLPSDKPVVTLTDSSIMCTMGRYSATPTSSVFSLFVDGKHVSTIFSALGEYLPDWIIPWATSSTITRTASLTSATWAISDSYKGKLVTCTTLAYSKNAIGLTSSEKATIK